MVNEFTPPSQKDEMAGKEVAVSEKLSVGNEKTVCAFPPRWSLSYLPDPFTAFHNAALAHPFQLYLPG